MLASDPKGRTYIEVTMQDTGSGLATIGITSRLTSR